MLLSRITEQITHITDDEKINSENYLEAIKFINNIYKFINKIKLVVPTNTLEFIPSFKGPFTCEKYNLEGTEKENEMRYFIVKSASFLEDKENKKEKIHELFNSMCELIEYDNDIIRFTLNEEI